MKKRLLIMGIVSVLALSVTACGGETLTEYQKNNTAEVSANAGTTEQMQEEASKDAQKVSVCIYYSNADASGFEAKEIEMDSLSPDNLIGELALVNVVSYDTKVLDFSKSGKSLTLDLSNDFSNYINMMGTAGEYIVIGSLVNTFLDAYSADDILITSNGKTLETSHAIYDKPLLRFEDSGTQTTTATDGAKEAMAYHLKDTAYTQDEKQIYYPQFDACRMRYCRKNGIRLYLILQAIILEKRTRPNMNPTAWITRSVFAQPKRFPSFLLKRRRSMMKQRHRLMH